MANPSPGRVRAVSLLAVLPWALLLFECLLVVPRYDKLFREHGLRVGPTVRLVLDVSGWVVGHVLLSFLLTFVLMGVSVGAAYGVQRAAVSRGRRSAVLLLVFGVPCGLFAVAWVGMFLTHRTLLEGLKR